MRNFIQNGQNLELTPPAAYSSGDLLVLGDIVGVAVTDVAANEPGVFCCSGVFAFAKDPAVSIAQGDHAHWDSDARRVGHHGGNLPVVGDVVAVDGDIVHLKIYGYTLAKS